MTITNAGVTLVTGDEARLLGAVVAAELHLAANPLRECRGATLQPLVGATQLAADRAGVPVATVVDVLEQRGAW